jgi:hypothetical protein
MTAMTVSTMKPLLKPLSYGTPLGCRSLVTTLLTTAVPIATGRYAGDEQRELVLGIAIDGIRARPTG